MLNLFVLDADSTEKIPAYVSKATEQDLMLTKSWQTSWLSAAALAMPNKVALHRTDTDELLGLMSYLIDEKNFFFEIINVESAGHSNANLLRDRQSRKKYIGIAKALFAFAVDVSRNAGCDGILVFKAKTTDLVKYYIEEFGARHAGSYDPYRLIFWKDAADDLIAEFEDGRVQNG